MAYPASTPQVPLKYPASRGRNLAGPLDRLTYNGRRHWLVTEWSKVEMAGCSPVKRMLVQITRSHRSNAGLAAGSNPVQ